MPDITLISPEQFKGNGEIGAFPIADFELCFLAQGDSWFSIGSIPPWLTSNLFDKMDLNKPALAVNCASPGAELALMTNTTRSRVFLNLLSGNVAPRWTALLLSGLGNDAISAAQSGPKNTPDKRLLAKKSEWGAGNSPSRYLSDAGWVTFISHARAVFQTLLDERDRKAVNRGLPIVLHTYDLTTPRNAGAGLGFGPWLFKAMNAFEIPQEDWVAVSTALLQRVRALILDLAAPHSEVHVVDTQGILTAAATKDTGPTPHWQNEIHPTRTGYRLLGDVWEKTLNALF